MANETTSSSPDSYTTVGTGDGSETSSYDTAFGLSTSDGSGNPSDTGNDTTNQKSFYRKDLDLVQNMRNCFAVVKGFKEQIDSIVLASGYGGWTIITENVDPSDRIEGLLYFRVTEFTTGTNAEGQTVPKYKVQAETYDGTVIAFFSDADSSYYDNSNSYGLTASDVKSALDELSHRNIVKKATIPASAWVEVSSDTNVGEVYTKAEVSVSGILSSDYPNITLIPATNDSIAARQIAEAGHISRISTGNGKITAYCYDGYKPSYELTLALRVLRGGTF